MIYTRMRAIQILLVYNPILKSSGSPSCPSSALAAVPMSRVTCTGSHISGSLRSTAPCQPRDKVGYSSSPLPPARCPLKGCGGALAQEQFCGHDDAVTRDCEEVQWGVPQPTQLCGHHHTEEVE